MNENLRKKIEEIKLIGYFLRPYSFPPAPIALDEQMTSLKTNLLTVDGYKVVTVYNTSTYDTNTMMNLQIYSYSGTILPFDVCFKIADLILGVRDVSVIEVERSGRKIYCWSVVEDQDGQRLPCGNHPKARKIDYKGKEIVFIDATSFY